MVLDYNQNVCFKFTALFSPISNQPMATWSPFNLDHPLFHQQRLSLTNIIPTISQQHSSNSNLKMPPPPTAHQSVKNLKNENGSCSLLEAAKSPAKPKSRIHNSVNSLILRSKPSDQQHHQHHKHHQTCIDNYKYFSNSMTCLDATKL